MPQKPRVKTKLINNKLFEIIRKKGKLSKKIKKTF